MAGCTVRKCDSLRQGNLSKVTSPVLYSHAIYDFLNHGLLPSSKFAACYVNLNAHATRLQACTASQGIKVKCKVQNGRGEAGP